jgi:Ca2+-transporting ATPase
VLCFVQLGNALSVRAGRSSIFTGFLSNRFLLFSVGLTIALQLALLYLPVLNSIFKTAPLDSNAILAAFLFSLGGLILLEGGKAAGRFINKNKSGV